MHCGSSAMLRPTSRSTRHSSVVWVATGAAADSTAMVAGPVVSVAGGPHERCTAQISKRRPLRGSKRSVCHQLQRHRLRASRRNHLAMLPKAYPSLAGHLQLLLHLDRRWPHGSLIDTLCERLRLEPGRNPVATAGIVDSQSFPTGLRNRAQMDSAGPSIVDWLNSPRRV